MFTGIHIVEPKLLDRLQPVVCDVIRDAYVPALLAGETILGVSHSGYFAEHSTPERYLEGNLALLREPWLLKDPPGPLIGADLAAVVASGARVTSPIRMEAGAQVDAGAEVGPFVVVGAGARVTATARLQRAVVWPGVTATGAIANAIVTPTGVVEI
jgi:NDP-sugar pyrophosphorylase family protein